MSSMAKRANQKVMQMAVSSGKLATTIRQAQEVISAKNFVILFHVNFYRYAELIFLTFRFSGRCSKGLNLL